jgi:hypothetical protein
MFGRRFLVLVAVLMGLTALAASVAPRQPAQRDEGRESTPSPTTADAPTFATVSESITTEGKGRVTVDEGTVVELSVSGPERDSVQVLGRVDSIDPTTPARFSLLADEPGEHPIVLVGADRRIGTLVVR